MFAPQLALGLLVVDAAISSLLGPSKLCPLRCPAPYVLVAGQDGYILRC